MSLAGDRCGLTTGGNAYCWGDGFYGTFGDGRTGVYSVTPVAVSGSLQFTQLTAGGAHVCGLDLTGMAYCWGNNFVGQLGIGNFGAEGGHSLTAQPMLVGTSERFTAITAAGAHTCALTSAGQVWCWGASDGGALVPGLAAGRSDAPVLAQLPPP
ncbi:MAG: RCC1 domain-containing protein [Gemmatimonadales bacterium]